VKYNFARGTRCALPIGPVAITAFGGYLGALDAGDVKDRFTDRASAASALAAA
jgi:hypothetical protein